MRTFTITSKMARRTGCMLAALLVQLLTYYAAHAQGRVGIGTPHPQAKLHIAGNLIIDTVRMVSDAQYVLTRDTGGVVAAWSVDSLKNQLTSGLTYSSQVITAEVAAQSSTTSNAAQSRVTLDLLPGSYLVSAYAETFNTASVAGVRMWLFEGAQEIAYGAAYSNTTTYGSWSAFRLISIIVPTTITLAYSSWPGGTLSYIRRARIVAIRVN